MLGSPGGDDRLNLLTADVDDDDDDGDEAPGRNDDCFVEVTRRGHMGRMFGASDVPHHRNYHSIIFVLCFILYRDY